MAQVAANGLTPNHPVKYTIENPNCMNRIVQWFRNDETSTVLKVGVLVLAGLALIGAGFLGGQPLVSLLGALPLALWAWREWGVLNKNIEEEAQRGPMTPDQALMRVENSNATTFEKMQATVVGREGETAIALQEKPMTAQKSVVAVERLAIEDSPTATTFEKMQAAIGGEAAYNELPVLNLDDLDDLQGVSPDVLNWLEPRDLEFPIMKGVWTGGRPFIAVNIKDKGVITFFQRNSDDPDLWNYGSSSYFHRDFRGIRLGEKERAIIHQIVVQKNHPRYTLADKEALITGEALAIIEDSPTATTL